MADGDGSTLREMAQTHMDIRTKHTRINIDSHWNICPLYLPTLMAAPPGGSSPPQVLTQGK